jgi:sulfite exporter TauE/SafE
MAQSALIAALLAGLAGGLHCLAMCGGYVGALSTGVPKSAPIVPANLLAIRQLVTHSGRLCAYVALGATFGAAGGAALASQWAPWLRALYVAANVLLLVLGVAVARGVSPFALLEGAGLRLYRAVLPAARPLVSRSSALSRFALGALWGLTPCGLVYGVLPVAMLSGSATDSALVMLSFGLGTLPNLTAAGLFAGRAQRLLSTTKARYAAGALIALFAIIGVYRALFVPGALAQGPFCIVP